MYTSVMLFALAGSLAQGSLVSDSPAWWDDYGLACKHGQKEKKPLAVFFGSGVEGWDKLSKDGKLGKEVRQILNRDYVCVYVDTSKATGKRLATTFEMPSGVGIVISDRTGDLQAFRHEGDLSETKLQGYLQKYADPDRVVRTTETNVTEQVRYYGPEGAAQPAYAPVPAFRPVFSGGMSSGGGC